MTHDRFLFRQIKSADFVIRLTSPLVCTSSIWLSVCASVSLCVADKYAYEEWKDRPELIPKGGSYYEVRVQ